MKIIICCLNLYGGGAERVASLWANGFHNQGHDVILFLAENKITYSIPDVSIVVIGNGQSSIKQYFDWYKIFKKEFNRLHPDVFISVNHPWAIIAKIASIGRGLRIVSTEHNAYEKPNYIKMGMLDKLHKFFFDRFVDIVTVLTKADFDYIGGRLKNVHVLPNPLTFAPLNEVPNKDKTILAVGRLNSWHVKGFDLLINAWLKIAPKYPDWKLKIIGYGSDVNRNYIKSLAKNINSNQFEILDFDKNIVEHYRKAAIFVLSSRYEGFGMALVEAMSQGCACIACDYKGRQKEIITNMENGLIAEANDSNSICHILDNLLSDATLQHLLQNGAILRAKDFELKSIMNRWNIILNI